MAAVKVNPRMYLRLDAERLKPEAWEHFETMDSWLIKIQAANPTTPEMLELLQELQLCKIKEYAEATRRFRKKRTRNSGHKALKHSWLTELLLHPEWLNWDDDGKFVIPTNDILAHVEKKGLPSVSRQAINRERKRRKEMIVQRLQADALENYTPERER